MGPGSGFHRSDLLTRQVLRVGEGGSGGFHEKSGRPRIPTEAVFVGPGGQLAETLVYVAFTFLLSSVLVDHWRARPKEPPRFTQCSAVFTQCLAVFSSV